MRISVTGNKFDEEPHIFQSRKTTFSDNGRGGMTGNLETRGDFRQNGLRQGSLLSDELAWRKQDTK